MEISSQLNAYQEVSGLRELSEWQTDLIELLIKLGFISYYWTLAARHTNADE